MKTLAFDLDGKGGLDAFLSRRWIMKYLGLKLGECNREVYFDSKEWVGDDPHRKKRYEDVPFVPVRVWHTVNGWHLEIDMDAEVDNVKAILMQCMLGDDYRRSLAQLLRIERGCVDWNNLYQQKWKLNERGQQIEVSHEKFDPDLSKKVQDLIQLGE